MKLNELSDNAGSRTTKRRVGRGLGSGRGKTSGRGHKGAKSRSGVSIKGFEGGQMPIYRRLPKRGFNNVFRNEPETIDVARLQRAIDDGKLNAKELINVNALRLAKLISDGRNGVRLLAKGKIQAAINLEIDSASKSAMAAIEDAGGRINLLGARSKVASGLEDKSADSESE